MSSIFMSTSLNDVVPVERRRWNGLKVFILRFLWALVLGWLVMIISSAVLSVLLSGLVQYISPSALWFVAFVLGAGVAALLWLSGVGPFYEVFRGGNSKDYVEALTSYYQSHLTVVQYMTDLNLAGVSDFDLPSAKPCPDTKSAWRLAALDQPLPGLDDDAEVKRIVAQFADRRSRVGVWWHEQVATHIKQKEMRTLTLSEIDQQLASVAGVVAEYNAAREVLFAEAKQKADALAVTKTCPECMGRGRVWKQFQCGGCKGEGKLFQQGGVVGGDSIAYEGRIENITYYQKSRWVTCVGCKGQGWTKLLVNCERCVRHETTGGRWIPSGLIVVYPTTAEEVLAKLPEYVQLQEKYRRPLALQSELQLQSEAEHKALAALDGEFLAAIPGTFSAAFGEPSSPAVKDKAPSRSTAVRIVPAILAGMLALYMFGGDIQGFYISDLADENNVFTHNVDPHLALERLQRGLRTCPDDAKLLTHLAWAQGFLALEDGNAPERTVDAISEALRRIPSERLASYPDLKAWVKDPNLEGSWRCQRGIYLVIRQSGNRFTAVCSAKMDGSSPGIIIQGGAAGSFIALYCKDVGSDQIGYWSGGLYDPMENSLNIRSPKGGMEKYIRTE